MKFRVGDTVLVTGGKDKGRTGRVERVFPREGTVRVSGVNMYKRHRKGLGDEKGGIVEFARPLPVANLALVCPNCSKQARIAYRVGGSGKRRVCVKCKREISVSEKVGK